MTEERGLIETAPFEFQNNKCVCTVDVFNSSPQENPQYTFKVCEIPDSTIKFSFRPSQGLVRNASEDEKQEENILGKLISIEHYDIEAIKEFVEKNGFIYPVGNNKYTSVSLDSLTDTINRIKATVNLMSGIGEADFSKILSNTAFLLFDEFVQCEETKVIRQIQDLLDEADVLTDINQRYVKKENQTLSVYDSLFKKPFSVSVETYNSMLDDSGIKAIQGSNTELFRKLFFLYYNKHDCSQAQRHIIEFFFRFQYETGVLKPLSEPSISFYGVQPTIDEKKYMEQLLTVAKYAVGMEINANISGIVPQYSAIELTPSWKVSTLLQAMYFSLFYMTPGLQIYRKCQNPTCKRDHYFLVNTSALKKKYCCDECRNAANQRKLRDNRNKESML